MCLYQKIERKLDHKISMNKLNPGHFWTRFASRWADCVYIRNLTVPNTCLFFTGCLRPSNFSQPVCCNYDSDIPGCGNISDANGMVQFLYNYAHPMEIPSIG